MDEVETGGRIPINLDNKTNSVDRLFKGWELFLRRIW